MVDDSIGGTRPPANTVFSHREIPMIAFHTIVSAYGFWLPNDPRGSWSNYVGSQELHRFGGDATRTNTTQSVASRPHDARKRRSAKALIKHPPVRFDGEQARSIAGGFHDVADDAKYQVLALAVMPTHLHAVIGAHPREPSRIIGHLKRGATDRLIDDGVHPCLTGGWITHSCWAKQAWAVYIGEETHLRRAIRYVENNPIQDGMPRQRWRFVARSRQAYFDARDSVNDPIRGPANGSASFQL
ncbi:MAG: transposase [Phycisphaeraceae bacterium]